MADIIETNEQNSKDLPIPKPEELSEGSFLASLKRNYSKIRADRAAAIAEDCEVTYRRAIEDLDLRIKRMIRERENMLDLSPTSAQSLMLATDFDSKIFVDKDIDLGTKIRNDRIKLGIAKEQFFILFGKRL